MKSFLIALLTLTSTASFAQDCVDADGNDILNKPEVFHDLIDKAESCYAATNLAEACAWGSSLDVTTAGKAFDVCTMELSNNNPSRKLTKLLTTMRETCTETYDKHEGTLYRSMNAYCHLSAINWINNLSGEK